MKKITTKVKVNKYRIKLKKSHSFSNLSPLLNLKIIFTYKLKVLSKIGEYAVHITNKVRIKK
jgi:hypothetical protein